MKRELRNVAASVYQRLRNRARERGEEVPLVHQRYAAERLLYRLAQSPHRDRFVLRGGMLYELWGGDAYRSTNDLDLLGYGSAEPGQVEACFRELISVEVSEDGLYFEPGGIRVRRVRQEAEYSGVEVKLEVRLKTARIPLKVDVGFGDVIVPGPEDVEYPTLLDGPTARIRAYSRESVVAEKLHAAALFGDDNTRLKDFYDLFVLSRVFAFEGITLAGAIAATFERRRTPIEAPLPLPIGFFAEDTRSERWRTYLRRNELVGAPRDFVVVGEAVREFLRPAYDAAATANEFPTSWPPGGPWG